MTSPRISYFGELFNDSLEDNLRNSNYHHKNTQVSFNPVYPFFVQCFQNNCSLLSLSLFSLLFLLSIFSITFISFKYFVFQGLLQIHQNIFGLCSFTVLFILSNKRLLSPIALKHSLFGYLLT